jgi:hypothetical protein
VDHPVAISLGVHGAFFEEAVKKEFPASAMNDFFINEP